MVGEMLGVGTEEGRGVRVERGSGVGRRMGVLALVLLLTQVSPVGVGAATIQDGYGNVAYDNGTVVWMSPMPVGSTTYKTSTAYSDQGLSMYFAFARSFINTIQPNPFPFDLINKLLTGEFDINSQYMEVVNYAMGFCICFVVGLLFIICWPMCGCCLCCCRCCGMCGGDMKQVKNENEHCKRMGLAQALFLMTLCMGVSAVCVYVTNDRFTVALNYADTTVSNNLDDIDTYLTNFVAQFDYVVGPMYNLVSSALLRDVDNLGTIIGTSILDLLNVDPLVANIKSLDNSVDALSISLSQVVTDTTALTTAANDLSSKLTTLANNIDGMSAACSSDCNPNLCSSIDTSAIRTGSTDFSSLPDLSSVETAVQNVQNQDLTAIADSAKAQLNNLPSTIDSNAATVKANVNSTLYSFSTTITGLTGGPISDIAQSVDVAPIKTTTASYFAIAKEYDAYRQKGGTGLMAFFLGLVVLFMVGLFMACLCHDKKALPTERGCISSCGGCLMVLGVAFMFLLGGMLMLLTTLTFTIGGNLEKICQPLLDMSIFKDFLDKGGIPGLELGSLLLGNPSITLKIYDILLGCRQNGAPFTLLKLNNLVPIEDYLNYTTYLTDMQSQVSSLTSIDLSSYKVLTPSMETALNDFKNSGIDSIDFVSINSLLSTSAASVDPNSLISSMNSIKANCINPTQSNWDTRIAETEAIRDTYLPAVVSAQNALKASVATLESDVNGVPAAIDTTLAMAKDADDVLTNNATALLTTTTNSFLDQMVMYIDSYATEVKYLIYNEIGACRPVWNLWRSFNIMLCNYAVDALNGFWFGIGWGLLFFLPVACVAMSLSGYYRKMDKCEGYEEFEEESDDEDDVGDFSGRMQGIQRGNNKVRPDFDD